MSGTSPTTAPNISLLQRVNHLNGMLVFLMIYMAMCGFNFGYDVAIFSGVQGMNSFARRFGEYDEDSGKWVIPGWLSSLMTAMPFLGKAIGCTLAGWIAERSGRRAAIMCLCMVSFIGVTLQTAAVNAAMFTIGRIITFSMTGMAIIVVPIYQAETAPQAVRGMFASTIQLLITFGGIVASCVTYGTKNIDSDASWRIPNSLQFIMPTLLFLLLPFVPESPRWLLSRDRREDAAKSLRKLRKNATEEYIQLEIDALLYTHQNEENGSWAEVFNRTNRVRTAVAVLAMFGQQITGQAFPSQYGVIFYQSQGYGDQSFMFNIIQSVLSFGAIIFTWLIVDGVGRRPLLMIGGTLMAVFLFILGGMGSVHHLNSVEKELMVSSLMLFQFFYNLSWAPVSYVVVSEAAASRVKEKTNMLSCVISVLTTFVTSFTMPYLINAQYANLGAKVGLVYGAINVVMVVNIYFFVPELKGRTLEEVDQLFCSGAPLRKFKAIRTRNAEMIYKDRRAHKGGEERLPKSHD